MAIRLVFALALVSLALCAQVQPPVQPSCANTPAYSPCELVFELSGQDAAAHPEPYATVELKAEFRSPRHRTFMLPAYWDGGSRMVIRFAPTEPGEWVYRLTGNVRGWDGKTGTFTAADSQAPGFVRVANVHHWAYTEGNRPHLWMGDTQLRFAFVEEDAFRALADARAAQKFTHVRGLVLGAPADRTFASANSPNLEFFRTLDRRVGYLNGKGIVADLILAGAGGELTRVFSSWEQRRRFVRYVVARYAAFNVTWQCVQEFEDYPNARALLKEIGGVVKEMDPYQHPRTAGARVSSATLVEDGWMSFAAYGLSDDQVGAIEHQILAVPQVNMDLGREDSGAGKGGPGDVDAAALRRRLWNATMNGQYVTFANTGSWGGSAVEARYADSPGAKQMTVWFDFFSRTRYWELEPYFDVDGGRAAALEDAEYVVYVEKPGPVELLVEKHSYDVEWIDPATGEVVRQKFKGERFAGEPPSGSHDWVLHVVREGRIEGMAKSYKFESREIVLQEVEQNPQKVPFEIEGPAGDLSLSAPASYSVKLKRPTHATRTMMWLWTGEVVADGEGYRVLATGAKGSFQPPPGIARNFPAVLHLRLYGMNAVGKVYAIDRTYQLNK